MDLHVHLVNNTAVNMIKFQWWVCPKVPDYFWKTFRACTIISKKYRSSIMVNSLSDWILRSTLNKQNNNIPEQLYQIQLQNYESAKFGIFIAIVENKKKSITRGGGNITHSLMDHQSVRLDKFNYHRCMQYKAKSKAI